MRISLGGIVSKILILFIRFYQLAIAPWLRFMAGGNGMCRHDPSCSHYGIEALKIHGPIKGSWLILKRLLRCHPWGTHGYDPVPKKHQPAKK
ncbi:MAG: membrane protein insertion efficiency factor YidD [Akkermansiaceae bacterium]